MNKKYYSASHGSALTESEREEYFRTRLMSYLIRRRTSGEARQFLEKLTCPPELAEELLRTAEEYRLLNDTDYAVCFIRDSIRIKHHSLKRIRFDLMQRELSRKDIDEAFESEQPDESEAALFLAERRLKDISDTQAVQKCRQYLYSAGFSADVISSVLDKILNKE